MYTTEALYSTSMAFAVLTSIMRATWPFGADKSALTPASTFLLLRVSTEHLFLNRLF
jgi:hypothetical protein